MRQHIINDLSTEVRSQKAKCFVMIIHNIDLTLKDASSSTNAT